MLFKKPRVVDLVESEEEEEEKEEAHKFDFVKTTAHHDYVRANIKHGAGFFDVMLIRSIINGKLETECQGCGATRKSSIGEILKHATSCSMLFAPERQREQLRYTYKCNATLVVETSKPRYSKAATREPMQLIIEELQKRTENTVEALNAIVATGFLGTNSSMLLAENPWFRGMLMGVAGLGKLSPATLEAALGRRAIATTMDKQAKEMQKKSLEKWRADAAITGGGFSIDGFTT